MRYPASIVIATIVLLGLSSSVATAGDITYQLIDYPSLQDGYHIAGTMTTDGTIGPLAGSDIVSWQFTIYSSTGDVVGTGTSGSYNGIFQGNVAATPTQITMYSTAGIGTAIQLFDENTAAGIVTYTITGEVLSEGSIGSTDLWAGYGTTNNDFVYASVASQAVPEPTSITLALLGLGVLSGLGFARWRRRTVSRPTRCQPAHS